MSLISCNTKKNQVISAATGRLVDCILLYCGDLLKTLSVPSTALLLIHSDNLVHVWRLYPHVEEALSLMMSFSAASVPSLMVATPERLCVACNNHQLTTYCIDMYNLSDQSMWARPSTEKDVVPYSIIVPVSTPLHTYLHTHTNTHMYTHNSFLHGTV